MHLLAYRTATPSSLATLSLCLGSHFSYFAHTISGLYHVHVKWIRDCWHDKKQTSSSNNPKHVTKECGLVLHFYGSDSNK